MRDVLEVTYGAVPGTMNEVVAESMEGTRQHTTTQRIAVVLMIFLLAGSTAAAVLESSASAATKDAEEGTATQGSDYSILQGEIHSSCTAAEFAKATAVGVTVGVIVVPLILVLLRSDQIGLSLPSPPRLGVWYGYCAHASDAEGFG